MMNWISLVTHHFVLIEPDGDEPVNVRAFDARLGRRVGPALSRKSAFAHYR